ncbi:MAG: hypothetical protein HXY51_00675 [Nitrospirae bacterium]|nr:hypothetical protein [Nitrospirota bacterium]
MRGDWGIVKGIVFVLVLLPTVVSAQVIQGIPRSPIAPTIISGDRVPEDFYIMPWIATGVVYDDNVFFAPQGRKQGDVLLRVTPGLQASYQSAPFTIVGNYRFDSEVYSKLDQLNSAQQRQFGTLETRWHPSTSWTIGNTFGYAETNTPFELNLLTSAQTARFRTERYFANPAAEYRFDTLTKLLGQYAYARDKFGGVEVNSNIINVSVEHKIGSHDTLGPAYIGRYFTFNGDSSGSVGGDPGSFQSHAMLLSWGHDFSSDTRLDMRAGPRIEDGDLADRPEAFVGLRQRIPHGDISLSYISAVTTTIGTVGATRTESVILRASHEPVKYFTVTVAPSVTWIKNSSFDSTIYTGYIEGAYQFNKYVTAKGSAYFTYQEGNFQPTGGVSIADSVIARNLYWLRLEFTYPTRWE